MMEKGPCEFCYFFNPRSQNGQLVGQCRFNPPTPFMITVPRAMGTIQPGRGQTAQLEISFPAAWPIVQGDQWCGKFEAVADVDEDGFCESSNPPTGASEE